MKVAVIDSGVHVPHPHIGRIAGGAAFGPASPDYSDSLGHGTAVMAAIQEKAPDAEYYALKVFHNALRTKIEAIWAALDWCLKNEIQMVNLSLGANNPVHAEKFAKYLDKLILISAAGSLPGTLPGVIAVELAEDCPREKYLYNAQTGIFGASGYPRPIPGIPQEHNLQGISFAVANLTGLAVHLAESGGTKSLRDQLVDARSNADSDILKLS